MPAAVEAFDKPILHRLARRDVVLVDFPILLPFQGSRSFRIKGARFFHIPDRFFPLVQMVIGNAPVEIERVASIEAVQWCQLASDMGAAGRGPIGAVVALPAAVILPERPLFFRLTSLPFSIAPASIAMVS